MARKPDIQYIRYYTGDYTDGSAARKLQPKRRPKPKLPAKPKARRRKRVVIHCDPVAVCGILLAGVMVVLLAVGLFRLDAAQRERREMASYLTLLEQENTRLTREYAAGYDPDAVREAALALGLVPIDQVERISIPAPAVETAPAAEPAWWEQIVAFFTGLFA